MKTLAGFIMLLGAAAQAADMVELRYQDSEADGLSYQTRILVSSRYLRMDEGSDGGDFILLDRKTGKIVNVLRERKMLLSMHDRRLPKMPPQTYKVEKKVTPVREGTVRVQVLADGKLCSETVAAAGLFPDAARALAEYKAALAYTQWTSYRGTPAELRQDCDLVHHVWQTGYALSQGLPIEERDYAGRVRQYTGGEKHAVRPELFRLPKGYERIQLPELEGAGVPEGAGAGSNSQPSAVQER